MTIKVFGHTASTYSLVVLHVLKELGLSYELIQLNSFEEIKSPEYLATKHPFGRIPSLSDDGFQIYECRAIARYLINKYQGTKTSTVLIPSDVQKAALVEQFISVETSYYTQHVGKLIYQLIFKKIHGSEPDLKVANEAREELVKTLDVYEKLLEGKDYLTGEFSLADLLHIPYTFFAINVAGEGDL
ncbi:glutathione S-transferase III [Rhizophagus irregularis]|uniref:glutathione transferase n=3 Tax=Rhizophagus irregularis TaxID=588596 RepID=A0A2I1F5G4_9GLOM|nr:glutathione S-transferase III [Rhizophagus irregularis DAOM 181602=DAOM 197198]EXX75839.1 Ure2p [Rhizophagus irregularis DAOM 197198w]PKB97994.1 glutathione S-transferase III [Rhizophagus irregularis]PKC67501.1 glutathione S-transferase III [Rhizophagus irregularis]PKY29609.1 glutathione S-transferase III [Rhizophagus irregularis]POG82193.1 glutathione S-transferase III [Rhizophagus irregularis DAOM 181602=DAOM 197198]|eukprot:XP_025189059.1 glutathione S-transferase III [Rhizophagus irregularis DAOM 181602=DAOM 197198]